MKELTLLKQFLSKSNNGTALLFTGAGFSYGSKNIKNSSPLDSKNLSKKICTLAGIPESDDLYYSSEYYLQNCNSSELITLLKEEYTIKTVEKHHEIIADKRWRRIYTTNYDRVFELASNIRSKVCETVNISSPPSTFTQKNQCVHLNGSIEDLNENSLKDDFKLTDSSYVTPDTLSNSKWKNVFSVDIEHSSAIFFVGYSMYDLDIKRILKKDDDIKSKTFFIVKKNEDPIEVFKLKQYGHVLDIGIEEFSKIVDEIVIDNSLTLTDSLDFFTKQIHQERISEPTDNEIINLFIKGTLIETEMFHATQAKSNYLFKRIDIEKNAELIAKSNNLVITGDIATGKTIYMKQIIALLCSQGKDIFLVTKEEGDYKKDLSIIQKTSKNPIFVFDNAFRHEDIIKDIFTQFNTSATFILAGRNEFLERTKNALKKLDFNYIEEKLDLLANEELTSLNKICNHIGYWGENNSWPDLKKEKYLKEQCEGTLSSILLKFFNSENIQKLLDESLFDLRDTKSKERDIIFNIILLGILPFSPRKSLISDLCGNDHVHTQEFKKSSLTKMLITFKSSNVEVSSGILSRYVLNRYFNGREIVDRVIDIITFFEKSRSEHLINNLFKELMRFKNINYMLPELHRAENLLNFYGRLKNIISWVKFSPHFWLQFGMANMFLGDYPQAQKCFETAYGTAKNDPYYDTKYIDNQMARWHIEFSITIESSDDPRVIEHVSQAFKLLSSQPIDYYYCKQACMFDGFYKAHFQSLSKKNKTTFEKNIKNIHSRIIKETDGEINFSNDHISNCFSTVTTIIDDIKQKRSVVTKI